MPLRPTEHARLRQHLSSIRKASASTAPGNELGKSVSLMLGEQRDAPVIGDPVEESLETIQPTTLDMEITTRT
jgi:hypothetical protein